MKTFKASQELVDILLKQGFTDETERYYPAHFQRMKTRGYDPYSMKRMFSFHSQEDYILLHYIYVMFLPNGSFERSEERRLLTENELKSLVAFYNLPSDSRIAWKQTSKKAIDLHIHYQKLCDYPEMYYSPLDKKIKQVFESINLNGTRAVGGG